MNLQELLHRISSGEVPTGAMGGGGILLLLIALKAAKGFLKFILVLAALALLAGAGCWHFLHQH